MVRPTHDTPLPSEGISECCPLDRRTHRSRDSYPRRIPDDRTLMYDDLGTSSRETRDSQTLFLSQDPDLHQLVLSDETTIFFIILDSPLRATISTH